MNLKHENCSHEWKSKLITAKWIAERSIERVKGLDSTLAEVLPNCEHRFFVQHMYCNFKKLHREKVLKDMLWKITRSSNKDGDAYKWVVNGPHPTSWVKVFFPTQTKSDMLCNNLYGEVVDLDPPKACKKPCRPKRARKRKGCKEVIPDTQPTQEPILATKNQSTQQPAQENEGKLGNQQNRSEAVASDAPDRTPSSASPAKPKKKRTNSRETRLYEEFVRAWLGEGGSRNRYSFERPLPKGKSKGTSVEKKK
ncbi:hypothetical protein M9H77_13096 [Catharanthus roseus]|uniref:Uncharacterized protein n=1 Tax=Catharanthus roseus TaxID=4058 RepID=A0ACC0BJF9_CATRO|nr:hypothetical protein M9H77_13096 [Catharanthus roseus]